MTYSERKIKIRCKYGMAYTVRIPFFCLEDILHCLPSSLADSE